MAKKAPEHGPHPTYKNEAGIAATMKRFGMTEAEAGRYLEGEWAEWNAVEDKHQADIKLAETRRRYDDVTYQLGLLPPELDAKRIFQSEDTWNVGKGVRVNVSMAALLRLVGPLNH